MGAYSNNEGAVDFAVVTVSDTRTRDDDSSGAAIIEILEGHGHRLALYEIVSDDPGRVRQAIVRAAVVQAVIINGGTGVAPRDNTYEAVCGLLDKRLDGFGELFRMLSYGQIGSAAMASRAVGGVVGTTLVFALPGSTAGCRLGTEKLIAPELGHLAGLLAGGGHGSR